jgi:hypothetical protein
MNAGNISVKVQILLANSEVSKFRLAFHFIEGTEACKSSAEISAL